MKKGVQLFFQGVWATCLLSSAFSQTQTRMSNACYSSGGDCGFHSFSCEGMGLVISVGDMHYGFKEKTAYSNMTCQTLLADCSANVNQASCCTYDVGTDCLTSYLREHRERVKSDCDGETRCRFHATYVNGGCSNPPYVYKDVSSYSVISYVCVSVSDTSSTNLRDGCSRAECTSTALKNIRNDTTTGESDDREKENDERMLQLIVGVSVGVGSGFIFLFIIMIVCWIRIRRKPLDTTPGRSTPAVKVTPARSIPRCPSKAPTLTSTMPSSHYSSFLYSDTIPSSHPSSLYPESIYSIPADGSAAGSIGPASVIQAYSYNNKAAASGDPSGRIGRLPELAERSPVPIATDSDGSGAPPRLPERPNVLKPVRSRSLDTSQSMLRHKEMIGGFSPTSSAERHQEMNGGFHVSAIQAARRGSESGTSSAFQTEPRSPRGRNSSHFSQSLKPLRNWSKEDTSSGESGVLVNRHQSVTDQLASQYHYSVVSQCSKCSTSTPHKEWWNLPVGVQDSRSVHDNHEHAASSVSTVPDETAARGIPVSHHSQDKHEAVQSWLGTLR